MTRPRPHIKTLLRAGDRHHVARTGLGTASRRRLRTPSCDSTGSELGAFLAPLPPAPSNRTKTPASSREPARRGSHPARTAGARWPPARSSPSGPAAARRPRPSPTADGSPEPPARRPATNRPRTSPTPSPNTVPDAAPDTIRRRSHPRTSARLSHPPCTAPAAAPPPSQSWRGRGWSVSGWIHERTDRPSSRPGAARRVP